jgi:hypothetical protein
MSYHYLQEQAVDCLGLTYSVGGQSDTSNGTTIVNKLSPPESETVSCPLPPSLQTCVSSWSPVPLNSTEDLQTWLQGVSPANHSASPGNEPEQTTSAICGLQHGMSSAWLDPATAFLKTFQACLIADISEPSLTTWPKAGIVCGGEYYPQPSWELRINEIGSGLWPTPAAQEPGWKVGGKVEVVDKNGNPPTHPNQRWYDKNTGRIVQKGITQVAQMLPTPTANEGKGAGRKRYIGSPHYRGAKTSEALRTCETDPIYPNPSFMEWLMGWPIGWARLEPLETGRFRQWLEQHGSCLPEGQHETHL